MLGVEDMTEYEHDKLRSQPDQPVSGQDIDVWGGVDTNPSAMPTPNGPEPCVRKINGRCTCLPGYERCLWFLDG
jgi:hypothetical protein